MKKYSIFTIAIITLVILIGVGLYFSNSRRNENDYYSGEWKIYKNGKYGYIIEYPPRYKVFESESQDAVSFGDPPDPLAVGIFVSDSEYGSVEDWLAANLSQRLEERMEISGYDGAVTHYVSNEGDVFEDKTTVMVKDGKLFKIETSYTQHDRILNSFKFE